MFLPKMDTNHCSTSRSVRLLLNNSLTVIVVFVGPLSSQSKPQKEHIFLQWFSRRLSTSLISSGCSTKTNSNLLCCMVVLFVLLFVLDHRPDHFVLMFLCKSPVFYNKKTPDILKTPDFFTKPETFKKTQDILKTPDFFTKPETFKKTQDILKTPVFLKRPETFKKTQDILKTPVFLKRPETFKKTQDI